MKTRNLLFAMMAIILGACTPNEPDMLYSGIIIGTLGCYDTSGEKIMYKGYFIETNNKDTLLSFNIDVQDSIYVRYGTYAIPHIKIPYSFSISILDVEDERYIHYEVPVEDAMHQPISKPLNEIEQVIIIPCK